MLATIASATVLGIDGRPVTVEVHVSPGLPAFTLVGQPDAACREARDRVRAAIVSTGLDFPNTRVTVNLAPSSVPKGRGGLDLPIAVGILVASGQLDAPQVAGLGFVGELGLDGSIRSVPGMVPIVAALGAPTAVVPALTRSARRALDRPLHMVQTLAEVVAALRETSPWPDPPLAPEREPGQDQADMAEVRGHRFARFALEVAAAGGHHLLLAGPPGSGKTMLATRLPGILPPLQPWQVTEVARVYSAAGVDDSTALSDRPPFRAPHHTATVVSMVGGGTSAMRPGEVSLASDGVLFLDELGEYPRAVLESLREPIEAGVVRVCRARAAVAYPARFLLVAATNPCPCGGSARPGTMCACRPNDRRRYLRRLSGPLLDRFDLRVPVARPPTDTLLGGVAGEPSAQVRARVVAARALAFDRGYSTNAEMPVSALDRHAPLTEAARAVLHTAIERGDLSARGLNRVRAVGRTVADLAGDTGPVDDSHIRQALALRTDLGGLDRGE